MDRLPELAALLRRRNEIEREIAALLARPAHSGHIAEYVAVAIFGIEPNRSASTKRHDGRFTSGPLAGKTVNVKYASRRDGLLNLAASDDPADHPDAYLVMTGPSTPPISSRGTVAPWVIHDVYLFAAPPLLTTLATRGVRPGTGASVRRELWEAAMVYPDARNPLLPLTPEQWEALALFAGH